MDDLERVRSALFFIPADDRETWVRAGMAVKSEFGDPGFDLWDAWSQQADSYNAKHARDVWRSIRANGKVTAGTLLHEAKAHGWRDDGTYQKPTPEQLAERMRIAAERAAREEVEDARRHAEAREKAAEIWKAATPAASDHPYLVRKRIQAHGARLYRGPLVVAGMPCDGSLIVPACDGSDAIHTLQFIHPEKRDGDNKRFLPGGDYRGRYFSIGTMEDAEVITALKAVRESKPADYQRHRKRIKDAGASVAELDRLVCVTTGAESGPASGEALQFPEVEPWPEPVDGAELLGELVALFRRYLVLPEHGGVTLGLWTVFTYCIAVVTIAPILAITSPEKRCGKSTVLALLRRLVPRSLPCANITAASLFRAIAAWSPTLLIDEADTFLPGSDDLRGILNSGHTKDLAFVIRTVGDDHDPRQFSTWGPKAIALIGKLKDTLTDRSIEVALKRKLSGERVERLRHADPELFHTQARRCARFAADHAEVIRAARPSMPDGLHDRAEDNWEPLLAIADLAGGGWPERARKAALALSGREEEFGGLRIELLADIRDIFEGKHVDRMPSEDLAARLVALEERPWAEYSRGKPLTKAKLARLLRPFGVVSGTIRPPDGKTAKGYLLDQFSDSFASVVSQ